MNPGTSNSKMLFVARDGTLPFATDDAERIHVDLSSSKENFRSRIAKEILTVSFFFCVYTASIPRSSKNRDVSLQCSF